MSQLYGRALSTRLFIQAAFTAFFALSPAVHTARPGWTEVAFGLAAVIAAVGFVVQSGIGSARTLVIGLECLVLVVFVAALRDGYWIPGTVLGLVALISALNAPTAAPAACATPGTEQWVPLAADVQAPAGYGPPPVTGYAPSPLMDNPYAPPAQLAPAEPVWSAPAQVAPAQTTPPPVEQSPALPPAPRTTTILPG